MNKLSVSIITPILLVASFEICAAVITWSGDENSNFNDDRNWVPMMIPGADDDAIFRGPNNVSFSGGATTALALIKANTNFFLNGNTYDTSLEVEGVNFDITNGTLTGDIHLFGGLSDVDITDVVIEPGIDFQVVDRSRTKVEGGSITTPNAIIGAGTPGTAILNLTATMMTVSGPNGIEIGQDARGVLNITNASTLVTQNIVWSSTPTSSAEILVANDSVLNLPNALVIGPNGFDTLSIEDGSTVSAPTLTLGTGGAGEVALFGELTTFTVAAGDIEMGVNAGSSGGLQLGDRVLFETPASLIVGVDGDGRLRVDGADLIVNGDLVFGQNPDSRGEWNLDDEGAPSAIDVFGDLIIGDQGRGEMEAEKEEDAIVITAENFIIGNAGDDFSSAFLDNFEAGAFDVEASMIGNGGHGSLSMNGGIWNTAGHTQIGVDKTGSVALFDATVTSEDLSMGLNPGSQSELEMQGTNMSWMVTDDAVIGNEGFAQVYLGNGAQFSSARGVIGRLSDANGLVRVTDAGTGFHVGNLEVADAGTGALEVINDALATFLQVDAANGGGNASILVQGTDSKMTVTTWLRLSAAGEGQLSVLDGGELLVDQAILEFGGPTVTDNVRVSGVGSFFSANDMRLGLESATAAMLVDDSGRVDCGLCTIGESATGVSQLTVDGEGSQLNSSDRIAIASFGRGALDVTGGGDVNAVLIDIGTAGGAGRLSADGVDSTITVFGDLGLSSAGFGEVHAANGGSISVDRAFIDYAGTTPEFNVTVSGAGSFFGANDLRLGTASTSAAMLVDDGGHVDCLFACTIGEASGGYASARVTGPDSVWHVSMDLNLANDETGAPGGGSAILQLFDEGAVTVGGATNLFNNGGGEFAYLEVDGGTLTTRSLWNRGTIDFRDGFIIVDGGAFDPGLPALSIDGADADDLPTLRLINGATTTGINETLTVGGNRSGAVEIQGGSRLDTEGGSLGVAADSSGHALVRGAGSLWDTGGTALTAGDAGNGEVIIREGGELHSTGGFIAKSPGASGTVLVEGLASFWFSTMNVNVGGDAIVAGGLGTLTLAAGASVAAPQVTVFETGLFEGTGTATGDVQNNGGVAPGQSPGRLTVGGDYEQLDDGTLWIEIAGTTAGDTFDHLDVGGDATLDGTLSIAFLGPFVPSIDDVFVFLTATSVSGRFAEELLPVMPGLDFGVVYGDDFVALAVTAPVPLPPAIWLLAGGFALVMTRRQQG